MAGSKALAEKLGRFDLCIALEPTLLRPVHAHKGDLRLSIATRGKAAHSSRPRAGQNAILAMLPIIRALADYEKRLAVTTDPELGSPTLAVTRIQCGTAVNVIPDHCEIRVDIRILPGTEPEDVLREARRICGERAEVHQIFFGRGMRSNLSGDLWARFQAAVAAENVDAKPSGAYYCTDCAHLSRLAPCVVWGPGDGAQAHSQDEFIAIEQILSACRILERFFSP